MAFSKLFNLVALSSLAVLVCSFSASPANALAADGHHMLKVKRTHAHDAVAKRKRQSGQRCKPRPTSSSSDASTPEQTPSSSDSVPATTSSSAPAQTSSAPSSNGDAKVGLAWANGDVDYIKNFITSKTKL